MKKKKAAMDIKKKEWKKFEEIIKREKIKWLYHFTDKKNLKSIKKNGSLYSWGYCKEAKIKIKRPGGSSLSRKLDRKYGLENYVRLCFTKEHPMMHIAQKDGRIKNPIVLVVDPKVIYIKGTCFSNINATRNGHKQGTNLKNFKKIKFQVVKQVNHFNLSEKEKLYYQAEVMVKTFIPLKYIKNI